MLAPCTVRERRPAIKVSIGNEHRDSIEQQPHDLLAPLGRGPSERRYEHTVTRIQRHVVRVQQLPLRRAEPMIGAARYKWRAAPSVSSHPRRPLPLPPPPPPPPQPSVAINSAMTAVSPLSAGCGRVACSGIAGRRVGDDAHRKKKVPCRLARKSRCGQTARGPLRTRTSKVLAQSNLRACQRADCGIFQWLLSYFGRRFSLLSHVYIDFSLDPPDSSGQFSFSSIQLTSFLVYDHIYTFWSSPVDSASHRQQWPSPAPPPEPKCWVTTPRTGRVRGFSVLRHRSPAAAFALCGHSLHHC
jgi:hypothetical protein